MTIRCQKQRLLADPANPWYRQNKSMDRGNSTYCLRKETYSFRGEKGQLYHR